MAQHLSLKAIIVAGDERRGALTNLRHQVHDGGSVVDHRCLGLEHAQRELRNLQTLLYLRDGCSYKVGILLCLAFIQDDLSWPRHVLDGRKESFQLSFALFGLPHEVQLVFVLIHFVAGRCHLELTRLTAWHEVHLLALSAVCFFGFGLGDLFEGEQ